MLPYTSLSRSDIVFDCKLNSKNLSKELITFLIETPFRASLRFFESTGSWKDRLNFTQLNHFIYLVFQNVYNDFVYRNVFFY